MHSSIIKVFHIITILVCLSVDPIQAEQDRTRVPGEIVRFDFTNNQCDNGSFSNRVGASIVRTPLVRNDLSLSACSKGGVGIESISDTVPRLPILGTNKDNTALIDQLKHSGRGISFELWFRPHKADSEVSGSPIFTLGKKVRPGQWEPNTCGEHEQADFQIVQSGSLFKIHYSSSETTLKCRNPSLVTFPVEANQLVHMVVTLTNNSQNAYINGQPNPYNYEMDAILDPRFNHWHPDYTIQLFGDSYVTQNLKLTAKHLWPGTVYKLAIYDRVLSEADVRNNFAVGLPPSYPAAMDMKIDMNEDAELIAGSHDPEWYEEHRNVTTEAHDLQMIHLQVISLDWDVYRLQTSQNITGIKEPQEVSVYIVEPIPFDTAIIYHADGLEVFDNYEKLSNSSIYLIPEEDQHSYFSEPYVEFQYCVSTISDRLEDGFIDKCDFGTVSVHVHAVNDPPIVVTDPSHQLLPTGTNHSTLIYLEGRDVDGKGKIGGIVFTTFPRYGHLYIPVHACYCDYCEIEYDERIDSLVSNISMDGEGPYFHVGYRYTGPEDLVGLDGTTMADSFKYRFYDWEGLLSVEETFNITVGSSLVNCLTENPVEVLEDTPTDILLHGADYSGANRTVSFQITGLPPHIHGIFYENHTNSTAPLEVGSILQRKLYPPYDENIHVHFKPAPNFFNFPYWNSIRISVAVSYRAIALDDIGRTVASSGESRQEIRLRNVNDRLQLIVPEKTFRVAYARTFIWNDTACSFGAIENGTFSNRYCRMRVPIRGIKVIDPDEYVDRVRVVLNATHGRFMLNPKYVDLTDFQFCSRRDYSYWRCTGNPYNDNNMTFMALPADLNKILSTIYFWSGEVGPDALLITIYDGQDGPECGHPEEVAEFRLLHSTNRYNYHPDNSSHPDGCTITRASIPIQVLPVNTKKEFDLGPDPVPPQVYFVLAFAPLSLWVLLTWKRTMEEYESDDEDEEVPEEDRDEGVPFDEFVDTVGSIIYGMTNNNGDEPLPEHYQRDDDTTSIPSCNQQERSSNEDPSRPPSSVSSAKSPAASSISTTSRQRQSTDYDAVVPPPATKPKPRWEKHIDPASGIPYFLDTQTGTVSWRAPTEAAEGEVLNG